MGCGDETGEEAFLRMLTRERAGKRRDGSWDETGEEAFKGMLPREVTGKQRRDGL
jgi:hypothetical protein